MQEETLHTTKEIARLLQKSRKYTYRVLNSGVLHASRVGGKRGHWRVTSSDLDTFLDQHTINRVEVS